MDIIITNYFDSLSQNEIESVLHEIVSTLEALESKSGNVHTLLNSLQFTAVIESRILTSEVFSNDKGITKNSIFNSEIIDDKATENDEYTCSIVSAESVCYVDNESQKIIVNNHDDSHFLNKEIEISEDSIKSVESNADRQEQIELPNRVGNTDAESVQANVKFNSTPRGQLDKYNVKSNYIEIDEEENCASNHLFQTKLQKFWEDCKHDVEHLAERKAKAMLRVWQRDCLSLTDIIESTLKEYDDIYTKAIAVKLQFDYERDKWKENLIKLLTVTNNTNDFIYNELDLDEQLESRKRLEDSKNTNLQNDNMSSDLLRPKTKRRFKSPLKPQIDDEFNI